ncbi:hypothetical protein [Streptomyces chartreusis]|uniref:hypothetical protein n=1 Tax=Streptomyces chartreusis TaxID=1969 RepID=UPI003664327C
MSTLQQVFRSGLPPRGMRFGAVPGQFKRHSAVRMRKTRFRIALYDAARQQRIWIPEQLHTKAGARRRPQRGAA